MRAQYRHRPLSTPRQTAGTARALAIAPVGVESPSPAQFVLHARGKCETRHPMCAVCGACIPPSSSVVLVSLARFLPSPRLARTWCTGDVDALSSAAALLVLATDPAPCEYGHPAAEQSCACRQSGSRLCLPRVSHRSSRAARESSNPEIRPEIRAVQPHPGERRVNRARPGTTRATLRSYPRTRLVSAASVTVSEPPRVRIRREIRSRLGRASVALSIKSTRLDSKPVDGRRTG